jgi:hypothetical protein
MGTVDDSRVTAPTMELQYSQPPVTTEVTGLNTWSAIILPLPSSLFSARKKVRVPHSSQFHRGEWEYEPSPSQLLPLFLPLSLPVLLHTNKKFVISTEAMDSLTVRCVVERPPHFAFACSCSCRCPCF